MKSVKLRYVIHFGLLSFCLPASLWLLSGCSGSGNQGMLRPAAAAPLSAGNINLIFVVSPD